MLNDLIASIYEITKNFKDPITDIKLDQNNKKDQKSEGRYKDGKLDG